MGQNPNNNLTTSTGVNPRSNSVQSQEDGTQQRLANTEMRQNNTQLRTDDMPTGSSSALQPAARNNQTQSPSVGTNTPASLPG